MTPSTEASIATGIAKTVAAVMTMSVLAAISCAAALLLVFTPATSAGRDTCDPATGRGCAGAGGVGGALRDNAPVPDWVRPMITDAVARCPALTESWLAAVIAHESGFNPDAHADDRNGGTWGLTQINEQLWREYHGTGFHGDRDRDGTWDIRDPRTHLEVAARYLCTGLDDIRSWDRRHPRAAAAALDPLLQLVIYHNAGPARLAHYPDIPTITRDYLDDVRAKATRWGKATPPRFGQCPHYKAGGSNGWGGHRNGRIPRSELRALSWQPDTLLRCDAAAALTALDSAFEKRLGQHLSVTDGYRSYTEQVDLARRKPDLAATPGRSNHGWGLAVDLGSGVQHGPGAPAFDWMRAHARRYGWTHPQWARTSKYEPWHWEFA